MPAVKTSHFRPGNKKQANFNPHAKNEVKSDP